MVLLSAHALSTIYMTGLIWFVQLVHYPLTGTVGPNELQAYQAQHMARTSWAVGPPMLIEAACTAWLLFVPTDDVPRWMAWVGASLLAAVWLSTALLQVPDHNRLLQHGDASVIPHLVATNWVRTLGWTGRGALALWMLVVGVRTASFKEAAARAPKPVPHAATEGRSTSDGA